MNDLPGDNLPHTWHLANSCIRLGRIRTTGELLTMLSIILLDSLGHNPTTSELSDITGLSNTNVRRHVYGQIAMGNVEEIIDNGDRRRRLLRPSARAKDVLKWDEREYREFLRRVDRARLDSGDTEAGLIGLLSVIEPRDT